ncbi:hydroxyacylglutathione hydrolase [Mycobacteroides abscessus subsp. abscessus]|nr:hydroxyacylglutathione hydrolase [Mycobacteroides abscessus subsp. abscessus]
MKNVVKLLENLYIIDGHDLGLDNRTGSYLLVADQLTIIETSASPSVPFILAGLQELGFTPIQVKNIIVTHIHLDHAGGAGLLLQSCPNATVYVHPAGKRHLIDPTRLIAGAKAVYGDRFDDLFDPIVPIPEDRIRSMEHEEKLQIGPYHVLTFYHSPGHANHHVSIFDESTKALFTGDTAGICYPDLEGTGVKLYLPSTSPNQFHPDKMRQSLKMFKELKPHFLCFGHYGMTEQPNEVFIQVYSWLDRFVEQGNKAYEARTSFEDRVQLAIKYLSEMIQDHLESYSISRNHKVNEVISLDLSICAMGLIDFIDKQKYT